MPEGLDPITRDFYEERRRKWRRSAFWRGFLIAAVVAGAIAIFAGARPELSDEIARFSISGIISDDEKRDELLQRIAEDDRVKALVVRINSPGGTTAGSEALYASLRAVAAEKPVVATMAEVAASGGYITAIAADHIVSRGNTLTGSIGVIMEYPDLTGVMAKLGVGLETVRSSELKAEPSPFRPTTPAARAVEEALIAEGYDWFRGLVGERRGLEGAALDRVANGAVFTGRQALDSGLVDEIGGEPEALAWLAAREEGLKDLPVRDWEVDRDRGLIGRLVGGGDTARALAETLALPTLPGLASVAR